MNAVVPVKLLRNKNQVEGEPEHWINLYEVWKKANYSIPYSRWVKYSVKKYGLQPRIVLRRQPNKAAGRPIHVYYVPMPQATELLRAIERRQHIEIKLV